MRIWLVAEDVVVKTGPNKAAVFSLVWTKYSVVKADIVQTESCTDGIEGQIHTNTCGASIRDWLYVVFPSKSTIWLK